MRSSCLTASRLVSGRFLAGLSGLLLALLGLAHIPGFWPGLAFAADVTWDGDTDGAWATTTNWVGDPAGVPGTGDTAIFNGAGNGNTTIDLGGGVTVAGLTFDTGLAAVYTIGSGGAGVQTLTVDDAGQIQLTSTVVNNQTIDANLAIQNATLSNASATAILDVNGGISGAAAGAQVLSVTGDGQVTLDGVIADGSATSLGITKNGAGTLALSGLNTFTGPVILNAGTLRATNDAGALGAGTLQINGGTLHLANDANLDFARPTTIAGDATIVVDRATFAADTGATHTLGTLDLGSVNLTVERGSNMSGTGNANVSFTGGTTFTGSPTLFMGTRAIIQFNTSISESGGPQTLTLAAGAGGNSIVILNGAGSWTGGTVVNSGTLRANAANSLGASGSLTTVNGGTVALRNTNSAANRDITFAATGTLALQQNNAATTFNIGTLSQTGGTLTITAQRAAAGTGNVTHTLNEAITLNGDLVLNAVSSTSPQVTTFRFQGTISDGTGVNNLTKNGDGIVILEAPASHDGLTDIDLGTLRLGAASALPSGTGKGDLTFSPDASGDVATLDLNGFSQTLNGLSSSGAGTSVVDNTSATAVTLTIGANDGTGIFSGTIQNTSGALSLVKTGDSDIILNGTGTYTGSTTVDGGFLIVQPGVLGSTSALDVGTGASDAFLAFFPDGGGDPMSLASNSNLTLGSASTWGGLVFQLGANTAASDRIVLSGTGILTVNGDGISGGGLINGLPLSGFTAGSYDLVSGPNNLVGGSNLQLGSLPGGYKYTIDTTTDTTKLTLIATAAAGGDLFWTGDVDASWAALAGGNTNWSTTQGSNTEAGFTPGAANTVNFSASGAANFSTELDNYYSVAGLNILSGGSAVAIAEGTIGGLTLGSGGIDVQTGAPATTTITAPVTVGAAQSWTVTDSGSVLLVSGNVSGPANLTKDGAGALTLSGDNSGLSGTVGLDAGTLNVNSATALGTGTFAVNGGTLDNTSGGALTVTTANPISLDGDVTFTGTNDLDLGTGNVTLSGNRQVTVSAGTLAVDKITGAFGLTKEGSGILEVGNDGDYSGATLVNAGVLQASTANDLSLNSAYTVGASGTLRINNQDQTIGSLAGSGIVENNAGTDTDILTAGGDNTSTVFSGTLQDGAAGILQVNKVGTGTLELSGTSTGLSGNLVVQGGILKITGTVDNVAGGTGTADLNIGNADNTMGMVYVGATGSVTTDTMSIGNGVTNRTGSLVIDGGTVTLTALGTAGINAGNGGYGYVGLQSGFLTGNRFESTNNGNGTAVFRVDGGTLTGNEYFLFRNLNTEFTVTGGQVLHNAASANIALSQQNAGTTVMTLAGGTVNNTGKYVTFGESGTNNLNYTGILNLTGGNLITDRIVSTQRGASTSTVNFNGGTLTAAMNEPTFLAAAAGLTAYVHSGGAIVDTAGSNVTISAALEAPGGDGLTGLTVSNAGSGYIGAPYVQITGGSGTGATAYATVNLDPSSGTFGQVTGVAISNPGTGYLNTDVLTINLLGGGGSGAVIATPTFAANASGGLTKQGSGTLTLAGTNTYTGATLIDGGTLAIGVNDSLADATTVTIQNGAFFDLGTFSDTVGQVTLIDGSITGTSGVLTSSAAYDLRKGAVSAILAGGVGLNKTTADTVALSGANTFSGAVSVTGGTLSFSAADQLGDASGTNTLSVNGGTLSYTGITTATLAANQVLSLGTSGAILDTAFAAGVLELTGGITTAAAANLTKTGPGTVTVMGTTDLNGGTVTVSGGTLNAGFSASGISGVQVDSGGALNLYDNSAVTAAITALTLANGSALGFDLNAPGTNDVLNLTGAPSVAGTISVNLNDLGGLAVGTYDLINVSAGALNGASWVLGTAPSGLNYSFDPTVNSNQTLRLTASSLVMRYWQGDQDGSWSTNNAGNTNWATDAAGSTDLGALPAATDTLVFSTTNNTQGPAIATTLDGSFTADSLQFIAAPAGVTSFTVAQGSSGTLTVTPQSANNGISVADNAGAVTISAPFVAGAAQTWEVLNTGSDNSSLTLSGTVSFSNAVTKTGDAALTLSGSNSGAGGLTVNGGTFNIGSDTAPGTGTLTTGPGIILDATGGARTLSNNNVMAVNGSFTFTGSNDLDLGTGAVTLGNNTVVTVAANTLTVGGIIGDGGSNYLLTKAGAGTLVLNGANTHGGGTTLSQGTLHLGSAAALGSGTFTIGAGTTFDNTSGGALTLSGNIPQVWQGDFTFTGSDDLNLGTGGVSTEAPLSVNVAASTLTVGGVIDDGLNANALTKTGTGTLVLSGLNTYDGRTHIDEGTLRIGVANALPALTVVRVGSGATAGIFDLNGFDQTIAGLLSESTTNAVTNEIKIATGQTLTINGEVILGADAVDSSTKLIATGGGNLVVNSGGTNFQVGGSTLGTNANAVDVDLSGLTNFTADLGLGTLKVGDVAQVNVNNTPTSDLRLATNNTITAGNLYIGQGTTSQNTGNPHSLILGSGTNIFNTNVIAVGSGIGGGQARSSGEMVFDPGDTTGTLKVRGQDGVSAALTLQMGNSTSTAPQSWTSTIDLTGHSADVLVNDVNMARRTQGNGNVTATLSFDQGTFQLVDDLVMAHRVTTGSGNATATINIGGGTFIVGDDTTMSLNTGDNVNSVTTATINITGGSATFTGTIDMAEAATGQTADSAINITGGTMTVGANIIRSGGAGTENAAITLNGGTLDMASKNIGTAANNIAFNAQSGTLQNLNQLNGGGTLEKTTSGVLVLDGTNNYTGATVVTEGTLLVNGTTAAASAFTVGDGAGSDTLGGSGTIGGSVTAAGGTLTAGTAAGIGTLTINGATSASAPSTWLVNLTSIANGDLSGGANVDLLTLGGAISSLSNFTLQILDSNAQIDNVGDKYKFASFTPGSWDNSLFSGDLGGTLLFGQTNGSRYTVQYDNGNGAFYLVSAIPEPETWLPGILILALGLSLRRRRVRTGRG